MKNNYKIEPSIIGEMENVIRDKKMYNKLLYKAASYLKNDYQMQRVYKPADIVNELCLTLASGSRKWEKDKIENLFIHMMNNIRSVMSNLKRLKEEKKEFKYNKFREDEEEESEILQNEDAQKKWEFENEESKKEKVKIVEEIVSELDDECQLVFNDIKEGLESKEISEDLKISVKEVENIKKRLKRQITTKYKNNYELKRA